MNTCFYLGAFKQWEVFIELEQVFIVDKYLLNLNMLSPSPRDGVASTAGAFLHSWSSRCASMGLISGLLSWDRPREQGG